MVRLIGAGAAALLLAAAPAAVVGDVKHPDLVELSGLAVSKRDPRLLWGHNDTGGGPLLYRLGLDGADLGTVVVPEARAGDWEDIAAFTDADGPALLIADVGDNLALRAFVTLYAVRDPGRSRAARLLWRLDFRYPDGPRDCEAVAVDPVDRAILLVSKRDEPPRLYRLALPAAPPPEGKLTAEALGPIAPLPAVPLRERVGAPLSGHYLNRPTALDIAADGRSAVLVTPRQAYRYRRAPGQSWDAVFRSAPQAIGLPAFDQIEAGALAPDGSALYIGGEGRPGQFARLPLQPAAP